ncbi:MAG: DUF1573 domain-containing protein [Bacteroidia bacterium]|nr:DUF1573 domain-containing protein [Bacteroidia bacterium]
MRKVLLAFVFSAGLISAKAQDAAPAANDNPNAPEITFEKEVHDYGNIKQGADGGCEFRFKNTGKEPLIISNARGSCGCTVPQWPKDPIKPGETGVLKVNYDTKRVGPINKTVTVTSNAKTATKTVRIAGNVEAVPTEETMPVNNNSGAPLEKK